jgi:mono/diheme cytochrome c family protein
MRFHPTDDLRRGMLAPLCACLLTALAGCDQAERGGPALRPGDAQTVAAGRTIYQAQCAACHGADLQGQPNWRERDAAGRLPAPPHDASGHTWHHPDAVLFTITKHGVAKAANLQDYDSAMPAYDGVLTDAEIIAVLSFIKSTWPADIRRRHDEVDAAARKNH